MKLEQFLTQKMPISNALFLVVLMFTMAIGVCAVTIYATSVLYDPAKSELPASNVQDAIDKLDENLDGVQLTPGPSGPTGPKGADGMTQSVLMAANNFLGTNSTTAYEEIAKYLVNIPSDTTALKAKFEIRGCCVKFGIDSKISPEVCLSDPINFVLSNEVTLNGPASGWQSIKFYAKGINTDKCAVLDFAVYASR